MCRSSPAGGAATSSRTITRSTSGWPASAAPRSVRERLEKADAILVLGCRLSEVTSFGYRIPTAGQLDTCDVEPLPRRAGTPRAAGDSRSLGCPPFLRAAAAACKEGVLDAGSSTPAMRGTKRPIGVGGRLGRRWRRLVGIGRHPARTIADPAPCPAGRRHRDDGCGQLRWAPRVQVPPTGDVPRAHVRCHGLRPAGGNRRGPRPSRPARRGARRRRRPRDDDGRARDRRPRESPGGRDRLRQRALRDDPDAPGPARGASRSAPISGRSTSPPSRGPAGHAGSRWTPTNSAFDQALRQAPRQRSADRHPARPRSRLGLARRAAAGLTAPAGPSHAAPDVPPHAGRLVGERATTTGLCAVTRSGGFIHCTDGAEASRRRTATIGTIRVRSSS